MNISDARDHLSDAMETARIEMVFVRPPGTRDRPGLRVRVTDCRILYTVEDDVLLMVAVRPCHSRLADAGGAG